MEKKCGQKALDAARCQTGGMPLKFYEDYSIS